MAGHNSILYGECIVKLIHTTTSIALFLNFKLIVKARSGDLVSSFSAELRIGEHKRARFVDKYLHYQISENGKPDATIGWLMATDNNVKFNLLDSTDFVVNSTSGELKTRHALDREQKSVYNLKAELIGASQTFDIAEITIDVLDM